MPSLDSLDTNAFYALGVPAYLLLVLVEIAWTRRKGLAAYGFADTLSNLSGGLGEVMLGLFLGPHLIALYRWAFDNFALVRWPESSLVSWIVAFLAADLGYYVYHRAGHTVRLLWCVHGVHHQSDRFNMTIAMRHPWFSDVYSAPFYAALPLLGIPSTQFFIAISVISWYALIVHTQLRWRLGFGLVAPQSHVVHHSKNPRYIGRNLGAMFTWWDRLFGTHVDLAPDDPPRLGVPGGVRTYDGARAQWVFFAELVHLFRQARTPSDKLRVVFGRPGWVPPGATPLPITPPVDQHTPAERAHLFTQFAVMTLWSLYVLWLRDRHGLDVQVASALSVFVGLGLFGRMLDGHARRAEAARLVLFGVLGTWRYAAGDDAGAWLVGASVVGMVTLSLARRQLPEMFKT